MAYDDIGYRRSEDSSADPAAYRTGTLAAAERRRREEELDDTATDGPAHAAPDTPVTDRLGIHLGWEVLLLVAVAGIGYVLWRLDPAAVQRPALDTLLVTGTALGLLTMGAGLSLRAGVPNLALGPTALAAAVQYAEQGDRGLVQSVVPALVVAAVGAVAIGLLILILHVPGWAATLAAALGAIVYVQLRVGPVRVQGDLDPTRWAFVLFGGFALLAVLGGALGAAGPMRRWLGGMRPEDDPALRRGGAVAVPVLLSLILSSGFAVVAGVLLAAQAGSVVPDTGMEWTGIAIGLALLGGTSAFGRRGGVFGTLFAVAGLTLFLDYAGRKGLDIALFAVAASVVGGGLIVTRLVETFGRPLPPLPADWNAAPSTASRNWSPDLPETWQSSTSTTEAPRKDWEAGPWGAAR